MIIESELRQQIDAALSGAASLQDLYVWLMARTWNMHRDSAPAAVELAADVEALFFERADGRLTETQLRRDIATLLSRDDEREAVTLTTGVPAPILITPPVQMSTGSAYGLLPRLRLPRTVRL